MDRSQGKAVTTKTAADDLEVERRALYGSLNDELRLPARSTPSRIARDRNDERDDHDGDHEELDDDVEDLFERFARATQRSRGRGR